MTTYLVTINGTTWRSSASRPMVAVKRALEAADKAHPKGIASKEARGYAIHIFYTEEATP